MKLILRQTRINIPKFQSLKNGIYTYVLKYLVYWIT